MTARPSLPPVPSGEAAGRDRRLAPRTMRPGPYAPLALLPTLLVGVALVAAHGPGSSDGASPATAEAHASVAATAPVASDRPTPQPAGTAPASGTARPEAAAADPADGSVYLLPGAWRDQDGRARTLADLAGRPRVVAFVYTSCAFACPRIVARMKAVEDAAGAPGSADPGFVLVSIDPGRDTPERLARFAEDSRLDPARWTLLNGPDDGILELSVLLDVAYRAAPGGEFSHANVLTLLDADGVPAARVEGLDGDLTPLLDALAAMAPTGGPSARRGS